MGARSSTRRAVADFVVAHTPSVDEMMTSMMAGPHEMPLGHVKDQTYRSKRKKKKRDNGNKGGRPKTADGKEESTVDRARSLVADAVRRSVDRSAAAGGYAELLGETAKRRQLQPNGRRVPLVARSSGLLESRVRRGLCLELQGDDPRLEDRQNLVHLRAEQEDR